MVSDIVGDGILTDSGLFWAEFLVIIRGAFITTEQVLLRNRSEGRGHIRYSQEYGFRRSYYP